MYIKRLLPLLVLLVAGCGHRSASSVDTVIDINEPSSEFLDSISRLEEADTVKKEEDRVVPQVHFSSVEELQNFIDASPERNAYRQGIIPEIANYSLDYASKLLSNSFDGFIIVDKSRMKVIYYDKYGRERLNYGMACGKKHGTKHKKADSRTPEGFFSVAGIYDSTDWLFTDDDGVTSQKKGQFGPRFIRLKCPQTSQIGIHGTVAPWSIGHRTSHGCIRVTNENIMELVNYAKVGMPVIVVPGKKDMEVNRSEGVDIPWIPSSIKSKEPKLPEQKPEEETKTETDTVRIEPKSVENPKDTVSQDVSQSSVEFPADTLKIKEKPIVPEE